MATRCEECAHFEYDEEYEEPHEVDLSEFNIDDSFVGNVL